MKNIENIDELREIKENGPIQIKGRREVVTGRFSKALITYREILDYIEVIEYKLDPDFKEIEENLIEKFKENTWDYFKLKDLIDSYN